MGHAHTQCSLESREEEKVVSLGNANHQNTIRIGMFQQVDTCGTGKIMQPVEKSVLPANSAWSADGSDYAVASVNQSVAAGFDFSRGRPVIPIEFDTVVNSKGVVDLYGLNEYWGRTGKKTLPNDCNQPLAYNAVPQSQQTFISRPSPVVQPIVSNVQWSEPLQPVLMEPTQPIDVCQSVPQAVVSQSAPAPTMLESQQQNISTVIEPVVETRKYVSPNVQRATTVFISEPTVSYFHPTSHAKPDVQVTDQSPARKQGAETGRDSLYANGKAPVYSETVQPVDIPPNTRTNPSRELHDKVNFLSQRLENIKKINSTRKAKNQDLLRQQSNSINKLEQQVNLLLEVAAKVPDQSASVNRSPVVVPISHHKKKATPVCQDTMGNLGEVVVRNQLVRLPDGSVEQVPVKSCKVGERAPLRPVPPEDQFDPQYFPTTIPEHIPVHLSGQKGRVKNVLMPGPNPDHFLKGAGTANQYKQRYPSAVNRKYAPITQHWGRPIQVRNTRMVPQTAPTPDNYGNFVPGKASRPFFRPFGK